MKNNLSEVWFKILCWILHKLQLSMFITTLYNLETIFYEPYLVKPSSIYAGVEDFFHIEPTKKY